MAHQLAPPIIEAIGLLLQRLAELDIHPTDSRYSTEAFGDFYVEFASPQGWLRIVRDRGQYYANGASEERIKRADLWRAHDSRQEFEAKLLAWLGGRAA